MNKKVQDTHPHLQFKKLWELTSESWYLLGQCEVFVKAISSSPILPSDHVRLLQVSLIKGAIATTAIEGNTVSEEELKQILRKEKHLPPSRMYQETEATNVVDALNDLLELVVQKDESSIITVPLILDFHRRVGKNLGETLDAIPGRFRTDSRVVGTYKAPDHKFVPELMQELCDWLCKEFHYNHGQTFADVIIQAIVAHVFLEWIHPFGDGNGRTGRLLEFYILLRGGNPDIASHILSNHYNLTRPEYYRQLNNARKTKSLSAFIEYALLGFRDGLQLTLEAVQQSQFRIAWERFVYDAFETRRMKNRNVFKRRRKLMLDLPLDREVVIEEIPSLSVAVAKDYGHLSTRTIERDIDELQALGLIERKGKAIQAQSRLLMSSGHLPKHRIL